MAAVPPPSVQPGTIVADRYRIGARLGAGGMGEVFEADHLETGVGVAIKLLRESASDTIVERFSREGKALAQMNSEHVLRVFDVGVLASGRPYIVMERLHGADLSVAMRQRGVLSPRVAVGYVLQACVGLAEAHGLGIVHRDLKPANLYLAEVGEESLTKILDFGISKVNAAAKAGKTGLTAADAVFGSPRYMPPEQLRATRDVDARADIWSLGVTLSELVVGKTPFHADDFGTLMFNILEEEPRSIAHVDPAIGPALDAVVQRCLQKDPQQRFATVEALADALAPLVDDGAAWAQRVRETGEDAKRRFAQLEGRAAPQVTRVLEPPPADRQTAAIVRISIAPIAPTATDLARSRAVEPPRRSAPRLLWVGGALFVIAGGALAVAAAVSASGDGTRSPAAEKKEERDEERRRRRDEDEDGDDEVAPTSASADRTSLPADVARSPAFRIAPQIVGLLKQASSSPIEVRDLLFFSDRAVLLVDSEDGLVRYDYRKGELTGPVAGRPMGSRPAARLPLDSLDLNQVASMVDGAEVELGGAKVHSIGLLWLSDQILWVCTGTDGQAVRFGLDGVRRDGP